MKRFIVYLGSGTIVRTGVCPDEMMGIQAGAGELVMEGAANGSRDTIKDGEIVRGGKGDGRGEV